MYRAGLTLAFVLMIHCFAYSGIEDFIRVVNERDETALKNLLKQSNERVHVAVMIEQGKRKLSLLQLAIKNRREKSGSYDEKLLNIIRMLLLVGRDGSNAISIWDLRDGPTTPLMDAIRYGDLAVVRMLLKFGANANARRIDSTNGTVLHEACDPLSVARAEDRIMKIIELLLKMGACSDDTDSEGRTAADLAEKNHLYGLAELVRKGKLQDNFNVPSSSYGMRHAVSMPKIPGLPRRQIQALLHQDILPINMVDQLEERIGRSVERFIGYQVDQLRKMILSAADIGDVVANLTDRALERHAQQLRQAVNITNALAEELGENQFIQRIDNGVLFLNESTQALLLRIENLERLTGQVDATVNNVSAVAGRVLDRIDDGQFWLTRMYAAGLRGMLAGLVAWAWRS